MANILLAECGTTPIQKVGEILVYEFIKRQLEQSNGQKKKKKKKKKKNLIDDPLRLVFEPCCPKLATTADNLVWTQERNT